MGIYLNTNAAFLLYKELADSRYFVDKSSIIDKMNQRIKTPLKYVCITKPRRFGKTSVLNMLGAYYGKACPSKKIFDGLEISNSDSYRKHLNKYNIIRICLDGIPDAGDTYADYMAMIKETIKDDIEEAYPELGNRKYRKISDLLAATGDEFIFIIDEWDYIFGHGLYRENHSNFLEFLRELLKDKPYVALAYMTGVLPIKQYSTGSALNMFDEYTMLKDSLFDTYFGFTEQETKMLCDSQSKLSMDEISEWYNGYMADNGERIYNPRSVVLALNKGKCQSFWTKTGKIDEVLFFLKYNISEVRDDVVKMVNHIPVRIEILNEYTAGQESINTREEIYAAMIIYGLLSYYEGEVSIPDKELMLEFQKALKDEDFEYVAELVKNSEEVLNATLDKRADDVISYLHNIHNSEIPILKYNDENSLACVVTLAYLSARNKYWIEREEKSGKGYADFIFYPRRKNLPGIVIELKTDGSPEAAIKQIKDKAYSQKLKEHNAEHILLVGISYDREKKEHTCRIEESDLLS